mgnify:CR=1 FL=1
MTRHYIEVAHRPEGWVVGSRTHKRGTQMLIASGFDTQDEARIAALEHIIELVAQGETAELIVKGRGGKIIEKNTYPRSSDPRGTPG